MIILASRSPRREELLKKLCSNFIVDASDAEEIQIAQSPKVLAIQNAKSKAESIAKKYPAEDIVIGADTIVVLNGKIFGKPDGEEGAKKCCVNLPEKSTKL